MTLPDAFTSTSLLPGMPINSSLYDFSKPFERISLKDAVAKKLSVDPISLDDRNFILETSKEYNLENIENLTDGKILFELFEELVEDLP